MFVYVLYVWAIYKAMKDKLILKIENKRQCLSIIII